MCYLVRAVVDLDVRWLVPLHPHLNRSLGLAKLLRACAHGAAECYQLQLGVVVTLSGIAVPRRLILLRSRMFPDLMNALISIYVHANKAG